MKNKIILAVLIFVFVIDFVYFIRMSQNSPSVDNNSLRGNSQESELLNSQGNSNPVKAESTKKNKVTKTELSKHNKQSDCWVGYNGKVYDITTFLPKHPGSAGALSPYCGTSDEFKQAFEKKHGTSKVNKLMKVGVFIGDLDIAGDI